MIKAHFLPKTYLKGFANQGGKISQFNLEYQVFKPRTPSQVAYRPDFYSFTASDGIRFDQAETNVLSLIESPYNKIIKKLERKGRLMPREVEDLFVFISFLVFRIPRIKKSYIKSIVEPWVKFQKGLSKYNPAEFELFFQDIRSEIPGLTLDELLSHLANFDVNKYSFGHDAATREFLIFMCESAMKFYYLFASLERSFIFSEENAFITGDHPYFITGNVGEDRGFLTGDSYFPLSKKVCLVLSPKSKIQKIDVEDINQGIVNASQDYIYSCGKRNMNALMNNRQLIMRKIIEYFETEEGLAMKLSTR